jgi:hypothetical protein
MTLKQLVQYLTKLAANARSPHVRRVAPFIALLGDGVEQLGAHWEIHYMRQVLLVTDDERRIVVHYVHPKHATEDSPRRRGGIVFQQKIGNRLGPVVRGIYTLDDAIAFRQRPSL